MSVSCDSSLPGVHFVQSCQNLVDCSAADGGNKKQISRGALANNIPAASVDACNCLAEDYASRWSSLTRDAMQIMAEVLPTCPQAVASKLESTMHFLKDADSWLVPYVDEFQGCVSLSRGPPPEMEVRYACTVRLHPGSGGRASEAMCGHMYEYRDVFVAGTIRRRAAILSENRAHGMARTAGISTTVRVQIGAIGGSPHTNVAPTDAVVNGAARRCLSRGDTLGGPRFTALLMP